MDNIYLRAAMLVDNGTEEFSCLAISTASPSYWPRERALYQDMFQPDEAETDSAWGMYWADGGHPGQACSDITPEQRREAKECRVLALLLAAAMHETGDL